MKNIRSLLILALLIVAFQNCARVPLLSKGSSEQASLGEADPVSSPFAVLTGEDLLKSMLNVTGTKSNSDIMGEYNSRSNMFALNFDLKGISSPMMIAVTSVGGEVCNKVLTDEVPKAAADRNFFGSIDFTKPPSAMTTQQFELVIRALSRNFWGRNETNEERALIQTGKDEFISNLETAKVTQAASTRDLMQFTCAAMISSVDAFTN